MAHGVRSAAGISLDKLGASAEQFGPSQTPLRVVNLFNTFSELARLVNGELAQESWLDAYLLTAGMSQLVEDHLRPDTLSLRRSAAFLAKDGGVVGRALARWLIGPIAKSVGSMRELGPGQRRLDRMGATIDAALESLADLLVGAGAPAAQSSALEQLRRLCDRIATAGAAHLAGPIRSAPVRVPTCFRNFDQHPDDIRLLARDFALAHPDRHRALLIVGVRTSGSYLAPLYAACLRGEGYSNVEVMTMRPGSGLRTRDHRRTRGLVQRGGLALLCDDPPVTGSSLVRVARALVDLGLPSTNIVLLLALFSTTGELPPALAQFQSVVLSFDRWSVHGRTDAQAVWHALQELRAGSCLVTAVDRVGFDPSHNGRGHVRALYSVSVADPRGGEEAVEHVAAEGVGLGYLGRHAIAVAEPLREFLPGVFGVRDGLLYRQWMPDEAKLTSVAAGDRVAVASGIAQYVHARQHRLALAEDLTLRQAGQNPAWEAASALLSHLYGRLWPVARALVVDRLVKRLMKTEHASVTDGRCDLSNWFSDRAGGRLVKVDWEQGSGSNRGAACCDPVFDLATVTAGSGDLALAHQLRVAYEDLTGAAVAPERWLLHQLAWLSARINHREVPAELRRSCSRALQGYYRSVYFDDLELAQDGPLCAIDIDGVLEGDLLGFPALTPASAIGLRALHAHGFRPLIVSGRSLPDVVDRCEAYRLSGGVAEYGSVVYDAARARTTVVTSTEDRQMIERLRTALAAERGAVLDPDYRYGIRASALDGAAPGPLPDETIAQAIRGADAHQIAAIGGMRQTDFVPASIDKGRGVATLVAELGRSVAGPKPLLAFAVGDTAADIPMLALAERPFAPAHAAQELSGRATIARAPFQLGFAEAVAQLIGHVPGSCPRCQLVGPSRERRMLIALLGVREHGLRGLALGTARLVVRP